jgi:threonine aldolase
LRDDSSIHTSFRSDNDAGMAPPILAALSACNEGAARAYGGDAWTRRVEAQFEQIFERKVGVLLVTTGTAANSLALAAMTPPWGSVICHRLAHVLHDECGAPAFFGDGLKLVPSASQGSKLDPVQLQSELRHGAGDVHSVQPTGVSISQSTEEGQVYECTEVAAISQVCRDNNALLHMDGARFANAVVALQCSPADITWRAGLDVLSFGATKNGAMGAEALIVFNDKLQETLPFRRKRAGHLMSKMRFIAAQMHAYLENELWLANARHANAMAQDMARGLATVPGVRLAAPARSNILFVQFPASMIVALHAQGFDFYHERWGEGVARLVTSFRTTEAMVEAFVSACQQIARANA